MLSSRVHQDIWQNNWDGARVYFLKKWTNVASWCSCVTNNFSLSKSLSCVAVSSPLPHAPNRKQTFFIPHQRYLILCMLSLPHLGSHTSSMKLDLLQRVVHSSFRPIQWHGRIFIVALKLDNHVEFQRSHRFVPQRTAKHSNVVYRASKQWRGMPTSYWWRWSNHKSYFVDILTSIWMIRYDSYTTPKFGKLNIEYFEFTHSFVAVLYIQRNSRVPLFYTS